MIEEVSRERRPSRLKKYYFVVAIAALVAGGATYIVFSFQPPVYKATGKFSYYYPTSISGSTENLPYTTETLTKSIAESIKTRSFVEELLFAANVKFDNDVIDQPEKVIEAKVISGSNIIQADVTNSDMNALKRISEKFFETLEKSTLVSDSGPKPQIRVVEPMYTSSDPSYPKPLEYAMLAAAAVLLIGLMTIYVFSTE